MIQIREIKAEETYPIRKKELRKNMTLSEKVPGDFDENTIHLGVSTRRNSPVWHFYENEKSSIQGRAIPVTRYGH